METVQCVYVQRVGITLDKAAYLIWRLALHSSLSEPLRTAHLIIGGVTRVENRHRA